MGATALVIGLSFAPSSVHTSYSWWGLALWAGLLAALYFGSILARRLLVFVGVLSAFAGLAIQSGPLDVMATLVSALELIMVALLLTPAMRRYTRSRGRTGATKALVS